MSRQVCGRDQDILDAIAAGRFPHKLDENITAHLGKCGECRDLAAVAQAFSDDYRSALQAACVPSSGLVWWKAEIRARQAALQVASRPITLAQWIACAFGLGAALAVLLQVDFAAVSNLATFLPLPLLYITLGIVVLLASVAVYFGLSDD